MLAGVLLASLWAGLASGAAPTDVCYGHVRWSSENGMIVLNGEHPFHLKGLNWFGLETDFRAPHGLWARPLDEFVDFLRLNDFNAVRLPFEAHSLLNDSEPWRGPGGSGKNPSVSCNLNPELCSLSTLDLMEAVVDRLGGAGILVLLDQHRIKGPDINPLWYTPFFPEAKVLESWEILLGRLGAKWNLLGVDLKNEPHGKATWGLEELSTDWNKAAERMIRHIGDRVPAFQGLFFVSGVGDKADTPHSDPSPHWWGGNLEGVHRHPINPGTPVAASLFFVSGVGDKADTPHPDPSPHWWGENLEGVHRHPINPGTPDLNARVVYSPHVYGPDVFRFEYLTEAGGFPDVLPAVWQRHFAFVENQTGSAVVIGEWGGKMYDDDAVWHAHFADFLLRSCHSDTFYWALNPNSGETGGLLLDDWLTPREDKLELLRKVQPSPSRLLSTTEGKFCLVPGYFANPSCSVSGYGVELSDREAHGAVDAAVESRPSTQIPLVTAPPHVKTELHVEVREPTEAPLVLPLLPPRTERPPNKATRPDLVPISAGVSEPVRRKPVGSPYAAFHVQEMSAWRSREGAQIREYEVHLSNNGQENLCHQTTIAMVTPGLKMWGSPGFWNLELVSRRFDSPVVFKLPSWATVYPGHTFPHIGLQLEGEARPQFRLLKAYHQC